MCLACQALDIQDKQGRHSSTGHHRKLPAYGGLRVIITSISLEGLLCAHAKPSALNQTSQQPYKYSCHHTLLKLRRLREGKREPVAQHIIAHSLRDEVSSAYVLNHGLDCLWVCHPAVRLSVLLCDSECPWAPA